MADWASDAGTFGGGRQSLSSRRYVHSEITTARNLTLTTVYACIKAHLGTHPRIERPYASDTCRTQAGPALKKTVVQCVTVLSRTSCSLA